MSPKFFAQAASVLELLRVHARIPLLAGCSSQGVIFDDQEVEEQAGLSLGLYYLPGAELAGVHIRQGQVEACNNPDYWPQETGVARKQANGWLVFVDPFHLDCESWLKSWNEAYAPLPVLGGLAGGPARQTTTQLYLNGEVHEEGAVAICVGGRVALASVISQGCTPIGETWTITKADRNFIFEIANRPAYEVLAHTFNQLSAKEKKSARGNLLIGIVTNEYREEFRRGDFLIRNLLGADPNSGVLAVGAYPRPGQTIQFQRRDAYSSTEDMHHLLEAARQDLAGRTIYGGCLCCCNGRGSRLFGEPSHDARRVQQFLGPFGLSGFFCNGELGPVGERNFLHGYTAALALFVKRIPKS